MFQEGLWKSFPRGSTGRESPCNAGDLGSIPRLGRSPGEGKGYHRELDMTEQLSWKGLHGEEM